MFNVIVSRRSEKNIKKIDKVNQKRVRNALIEIEKAPYTASNTKKLVDSTAFRKRVGEYRIIYEIKDDVSEVHVIDVSFRDSAYKHKR